MSRRVSVASTLVAQFRDIYTGSRATQAPQGARCTGMMTSPPCVHPLSWEQGLLHGFGGITWAVVLTQSLGGILVAVCIKFADNILRTFAQTVAVLFGAFGSYFLFDFRITASFNVSLLYLLLSLRALYTHNSLLVQLCTSYCTATSYCDLFTSYCDLYLLLQTTRLRYYFLLYRWAWPS